MGIVFSSNSARGHATNDVISESGIMENAMEISSDNEDKNLDEQCSDTEIYENMIRRKSREKEMSEFNKQLNVKREQRKEILARHRAQKEELEEALNNERKSKLELSESNRLLRELLIKNNIDIPEDIQSSKDNLEITNAIVHIRDEFENLKNNNNKLRRELAECNFALQSAYSDIAELNDQNTESIKQISALKEVISVSKTMNNLREQQLTELKNKLADIEKSLADRETRILSNDLRQEYEKQLQNIRTLRGLYEERARLAEVTRQGLVRELEEQKFLTQTEVNKCIDLSTKVEELEKEVNDLRDVIENKNYQISSSQNETSGLKAEMSVVNKLFSQVLLGYKTKQDLDKLVHRLEENHGLLTHMAERENGSEASSALPKLLLELVSQVDEGEDKREIDWKSPITEEFNICDRFIKSETHSPSNTTAEEIVQNLPKVWRVLMELLSHQTVADTNTSEKVTTCYKSVETQSGSVQVPSVSQTYIRLKDLILEKLALIKEVNRMKQLNVHLESRLEEQERKLSLVTTELSKTWHVVGRLRRHHHQLHTHEKILKYELQQKRKLLNELKEELEYCREKWEQAREKNSQSEKDWRKLRAEFSSRKTKSPSFNNSAESGYSDERPSDDSSESNDDSEYVNEPLIRCKKKIKKSFETILDSSTDFNLAAEREDPASDMMDVADLPLDTQEGDDNQMSESDYCNSGNLRKSEKVCEETEDEIGDITNDFCVDDTSVRVHVSDSDHYCEEQNTVKNYIRNEKDEEILNDCASSSICNTTEVNNTVAMDAKALIRNIIEQDNKNSKDDKKPECSQKISNVLLNETHSNNKYSNLHFDNSTGTQNNENEATTSNVNAGNRSDDQETSKIDSNLKNCISIEVVTRGEEILMNLEHVSNISSALNEDHDSVSEAGEPPQIETQNVIVNKSTDESSSSHSLETNYNGVNVPEIVSINPKEILESIKRQNERLAKKEERLKSLENNCSEVVNSISQTLHSGDEIIEKLNNKLKSGGSKGNCDNNLSDIDDMTLNSGDSEPSTSNEIDHEAIFAARDVRLKMLEEQTKCLVKKVNKTTTKGVKIHYKLEELHNLYGSESSRAPSEDNDEAQQIPDSEINKKEKSPDDENSDEN